MTDQMVDLAGIRRSLQSLSRGQLLIIAARAVEALPSAAVQTLLGDFIPVDTVADDGTGSATLLDEVRALYALSMSGHYFEDFPVAGWNCTQQSKGTDAFIAEFNRLVEQRVIALSTGPKPGCFGRSIRAKVT